LMCGLGGSLEPKTCCARNCTTDPGPGQRKIRASGLMDLKRSTTTAMVLALPFLSGTECGDFQDIYWGIDGDWVGMGMG
jgi:hypothetical protein